MLTQNNSTPKGAWWMSRDRSDFRENGARYGYSYYRR